MSATSECSAGTIMINSERSFELGCEGRTSFAACRIFSLSAVFLMETT